MTAGISLPILVLALALPVCAQDIGTPESDAQAGGARAAARLQSLRSSVEAQVAVLDGTVVAGIVTAGDGRLTNLFRAAGRLARSLEAMLKWSKSIAASNPPNRAPFDGICKDLTGKDCAGGGSGEGLLTSLKDEQDNLRQALKRMKAERRSKARTASDACLAAAEEASPTRMAARSTTRLAVVASALSTALSPGGSLGNSLDGAAAQGSKTGKQGKTIAAFARRAKANAIRRQKAFMKSLTGKEKATKTDLKTLGVVQANSSSAANTFDAVGLGLKEFSGPHIGQDSWAKISGMMLEVNLVGHDSREVVADVTPMLSMKKTFLIGKPLVAGSDVTTGLFPALKNSEEAVRRACGVRDAMTAAMAALSQSPP